MGAGAFIEPLVVLSLLVGGTLINRERRVLTAESKRSWGFSKRRDSAAQLESGSSSRTAAGGLLSSYDGSSSPVCLTPDGVDWWRARRIGLFGWTKEIRSPDTRHLQHRLLSRILRRFPFLVEVWYWALIYWVYQLGRAFTAVTLVEGTVHTARRHALQLIDIEQRLHIFWEMPIQQWLMQYPTVMRWINRIYSFIHIPGTILFLIWLYFTAITSHRLPSRRNNISTYAEGDGSHAGSALYQARRRTMAMCNLIAFIVFTAWPCMPPRLLSDPTYTGADAKRAKSFGFVDSVHGAKGESSVWTTNKWCNQYAAMPSLHFGYSLLIGLTIMTIPLASQNRNSWSASIGQVRFKRPSARRILCVSLGGAYPALILLAIIATANHFILDAVAGAIVCGVAWHTNGVLLNFLALEDWFLWCLRIHKPDIEASDVLEGGHAEEMIVAKVVMRI